MYYVGSNNVFIASDLTVFMLCGAFGSDGETTSYLGNLIRLLITYPPVLCSVCWVARRFDSMRLAGNPNGINSILSLASGIWLSPAVPALIDDFFHLAWLLTLPG
jgi:hypothetical protein